MKQWLWHILLRRIFLFAVFSIGASEFDYLVAQVSYYVGDSFNLNPPSVAGIIDAAAWTVDVKGVSVSGNANGAHVSIDSFFSGTATIDCQYAYRKYGGGHGNGHAYYTFTCRRSEVKLNETNLRLKIGQTYTLKYINSSGFTLSSIMWETSDYKIANFDGNKKSYEQTVDVFANSVGECVVTFYPNCGGDNRTCNIIVYSEPATDISLEPQELVLIEGKSQYIHSRLTPEDAYTQITWGSSNEHVATVSSSGNVTAVSGGSTTITAWTDNGLSAQAKVTVIPLPQSVSLKSSVDVQTGYQYQLKPEFFPSGAVAKIKWESSNNKIVSVDENGKIRGKNTGTATITVTTENGKTATCMVRVSNPSDGMDSRDVLLRVNSLRVLINKSVSHIK